MHHLCDFIIVLTADKADAKESVISPAPSGACDAFHCNFQNKI